MREARLRGIGWQGSAIVALNAGRREAEVLGDPVGLYRDTGDPQLVPVGIGVRIVADGAGDAPVLGLVAKTGCLIYNNQ